MKRLESEILEGRLKEKEYYDNRHHVQDSLLKTGDTVIIKQPRINKLTPEYSPVKYTITDRHRDTVTLKSPAGKIIQRNVNHAKKFFRKDGESTEGGETETELPYMDKDIPTPRKEPEQSVSVENKSEVVNRRPVRERKPPSQLKDYVVT